MTPEQAIIGTRVRSLIAFYRVPKGTEGVIDELYKGGCLVAWDLPNSPLPPGYRQFDRNIGYKSYLIRDGFSHSDLQHLEVVQ